MWRVVHSGRLRAWVFVTMPNSDWADAVYAFVCSTSYAKLRAAYSADNAARVSDMMRFCLILQFGALRADVTPDSPWSKALNHLTHQNQPVFMCMVDAYPSDVHERIRAATQLCTLLQC